MARFQSVLARIGTLGVAGVSAQVLMNEAVKKRRLPWRWSSAKSSSHENPTAHLYIMAGSGLRDELIGKLTIEGGTHLAGRVRDSGTHAGGGRGSPQGNAVSASKLLTEHGAVARHVCPDAGRRPGLWGRDRHSKRVRRFTQQEQEFLSTMANTVGMVLERRRHEETQMDFYHRLFLSAQDGVMMTDTTGTIVDWNPAMERTTGWTREEALGQPSGDSEVGETCAGIL